ncbi:hypothetical protein RBU49_11765 [Clostridium sp. MB40-C1]|uniref:hypothetical protein n=1 Tax=Clostridium sp. MB40-C1 TaxID=3070996 RepID=UPI0027E1035F|nr:hypothetical protein [Clostridium sp. MB40-C1]WMJ79566.1 hypothetical protein RBU49_11765 [Clostridium sp. MB40-C1]
MLVARIKHIKEETYNLIDIKDLEELVIDTMGEDVWLAIMDFTQSKVEELKEDIRYMENDSKSDDTTICSLRSGINEEIETLEKLIDKVNEAKRLDRRSVINELRGSIKRLENNEGYF